MVSLENKNLGQTWGSLGFLWAVSLHTAVEGTCFKSTIQVPKIHLQKGGFLAEDTLGVLLIKFATLQMSSF